RSFRRTHQTHRHARTPRPAQGRSGRRSGCEAGAVLAALLRESQGTLLPLRLVGGWTDEEEEFNFAHLEFDYAGSRVTPQQGGDLLEHFADNRLRRVRRHSALENKAERALSDAGLEHARHVLFDYDVRKLARELTFADPSEWLEFVRLTLPALRD